LGVGRERRTRSGMRGLRGSRWGRGVDVDGVEDGGSMLVMFMGI
jgi:hypothetical protein